MLRLNNIKFYRSDSSLYFCCVVLHFLRKEYSVRSHSWDPSSYREPPLQIAQLIIERIIEDEYQEVEELDSTTRGEQGFGSTDKAPKEALQIREITAKEFGWLHR